MGCTTGVIFVADRRSFTFLRKVSFSALATSLGDVTILSLDFKMAGVLLKDLFDVLR